MPTSITNWMTQIRKGYLELCLLSMIETHGKLYGFHILEILSQMGLQMKEGTLYPLLNRLTSDGILKAIWQTENNKGHPRKFYQLTHEGKKSLEEMKKEFERMNSILEQIQRSK